MGDPQRKLRAEQTEAYHLAETEIAGFATSRSMAEVL